MKVAAQAGGFSENRNCSNGPAAAWINLGETRA